RRGDAARDGQRADRTVVVGAETGDPGVRTTTGNRLVRLLSQHTFLVIVCLASLYPLWFIVSTAVRSNAAYQLDPTGFPSHPTLSALRSIVFHQPLPRWMWNSF